MSDNSSETTPHATPEKHDENHHLHSVAAHRQRTLSE